MVKPGKTADDGIPTNIFRGGEMSISRVICISLTFLGLLLPTAVSAQTSENDGIASPLVGSEPATRDATSISTSPEGTEPAPPISTPVDPEEAKPVVVEETIPPHLKSFGAALSWRTNFDKDGPIGGAMFSVYYHPNYYLGLEVSGFNIVSMTFMPPEYGDRSGGGVGLAIKYFPLKYEPVGYSYYLKAGAVYEQVEYVDPVLDRNEKADCFGFEAGGGVMFTLGSTLSVGFEASFLGTFTGDNVEPFQPAAGAGPFDRVALVLKLYLMVRWNLVHWAQGPDGKFRDANRGQ
jgi:hypothetical protein